MALADLKDIEIERFILNYEERGLEVGGKYTLADLRVEKLRRIKSPFPPAEVAKTIVSLARESDDGLVTYKEVWQKFRPDTTWSGNGHQTEIGKALGAVISYCIDHDLPLLSALVVKTGKRMHSDEAVSNIYNVARKHGIKVGLDAKAFVKMQQEEALKLVADSLPS